MNQYFSGFLTLTNRRGFLLLVVIGLLAVLLAICVGFLSYTRGETASVATIRNKVDVADIGISALDWTVANISNDLLDGTGTFRSDASGIVSNVRNSGQPGYRWWYRPFEPKTSSWINSYVSNPASWKVTPAADTDWIYLPEDYYPEGGVRGRYSVQVLDLNAFMNINDWLEDGNPTQCQVAHMFMDYYGDQKWNRHRNVRDFGTWGLPAGSFGIAPTGYAGLAPLRYHEAWRVATRTMRYTYWRTWYFDDIVDGIVSPNWTTTNTVWLGLKGVEAECIAPAIESDGMALRSLTPKPGPSFGSAAVPKFYYPPTSDLGFVPGKSTWVWGAAPGGGSYGGTTQNYDMIKPYDGLPLALWSYVDPDTGRSPININTCMHTGEKVPMNYWDGLAVFPLSAVFNVESLRRIIKVGEFYFDDDNNPTTPKVRTYASSKGQGQPEDPDYLFGKTGAGVDRWTAAQQKLGLQIMEDLRTKLAYQYQETLVRYFTATYAYNNIMPAIGSNGTRRFVPFSSTVANTYFNTYKGPPPACGVAEAGRVKHSVQSSDYSKTRFPCGLETFRQWVAEDLQTISSSVKNAQYTGANADGELTVGFDSGDRPEIAQGKLDKRTANAVFDNMIPGKRWKDSSGSTHLLLFEGDLRPGIRDPLWELYQQRIGQDETQKESYNVYHRYDRDPASIVDSGINYGDKHVWARGRDIAGANAEPGPYVRVGDVVPAGEPPAPSEVPYRQLAFGPDWFSTELTTTSTTFILIINAQIVDAASVKKDFKNPLVLCWNQTGAVVEIAPDVLRETPGNGGSWPLGSNADHGDAGLGFYQGGWPRRIKTDLDKNSEYAMDKFPDGTLKKTHTDNGDFYTAAKEWIDQRGIERGQEGTFYGSADQTRRRVVIRTIWNLNQGLK